MQNSNCKKVGVCQKKITTNDDKIASFARSFQNRGRDMTSSSEIYSIPGRNVRMPEISALLSDRGLE